MPVFRDENDLEVTAASSATVRALDRFGQALLGFSAKVDTIVAVADADPECPTAQCFAAQYHASAETADGMATARTYLARAESLTKLASPREKAMIKAAEHWCRNERSTAARVLEAVLDDHPADVVNAKWAQALHYDTGNAAGILRAPLKVAMRCDGNAYVHGMLAFGFEECHLIDQAEQSVKRAISLKRAEPWAHHAMAHINEARHTLEDGIGFMLEMSDTWTGLTSFMSTHNWWHICLFLIDLGRIDEVLEHFDKQVWARNHGCVQDQINAISLLYRLERIGVDVGDRWASVAKAAVENAGSQISVFLDFQFLYALARAGLPEAEPMAERITQRAETANPDERIAWRDVAAPIAPGILALAKRDFPMAVRQIAKARPSLQSIGGSHAQRELVALFYIDALRGAGEWSKVQQILSQRRRARPKTSWIKAQLSEAYSNLGLAQVIALNG
jgi:hypothetical protein